VRNRYDLEELGDHNTAERNETGRLAFFDPTHDEQRREVRWLVRSAVPIRNSERTQGPILMDFRILKIILWPTRPDFEPRVIDLDKPGVQVISGVSKTGKSAIIPIVDYCLGADKCAIPVETIRNACSWFGVLIRTDAGQMLLARREPGLQKSTGDMYVSEGNSATFPNEPPTKNYTAEAARSKLDELAGLSRLNFDAYGSGSGFKARPSFRDMMAFTFQPQNIVANPDVLFFKADTYEHREKLKAIFPYVLGAITPEVLAAQHELEFLRKELARKERELTNIRSVSERWHAELTSWISHAREYGLIDLEVSPNVTRMDMIDALKDMVVSRKMAVIDTRRVDESIQELVGLQEEESKVDTQLRVLRRRLNEMAKLRDSSTKYSEALRIQRDRLSIAQWLHSLEDETHSCPLCNSPLPHESKELSEFYSSLVQVERQVYKALTIPASFDREMTRAREEMELLVEKLRGINLRKLEVESRSEEAKASGFRTSEVARFLGRVEKGLEVQESIGTDGELAYEVTELQERVRSLARVVSQAGVTKRLNSALDRISLFAHRHIPKLDAERPNDPISLSLTDLTVRIKGQYREDYLWEVGSGANWLSYHIAVSLALQELFLSQTHSPVPSFLVYDQPSQVYFPRRLSGRTTSKDLDPKLLDEDVIAVQKAFSTLAEAMKSTQQKLQILVLDHAGSDVWGGIPGVSLVEDWRGSKKLVPVKWLETV
jgi:Protein of unknown function (DUF3732)